MESENLPQFAFGYFKKTIGSPSPASRNVTQQQSNIYNRTHTTNYAKHSSYSPRADPILRHQTAPISHKVHLPNLLIQQAAENNSQVIKEQNSVEVNRSSLAGDRRNVQISRHKFKTLKQLLQGSQQLLSLQEEGQESSLERLKASKITKQPYEINTSLRGAQISSAPSNTQGVDASVLANLSSSVQRINGITAIQQAPLSASPPPERARETLQHRKEFFLQITRLTNLLREALASSSQLQSVEGMGKIFMELLQKMAEEKGMFQESLIFVGEVAQRWIFCTDDTIYSQMSKILRINIVNKNKSYAELLQLSLQHVQQLWNLQEEIKMQNSQLQEQIKQLILESETKFKQLNEIITRQQQDLNTNREQAEKQIKEQTIELTKKMQQFKIQAHNLQIELDNLQFSWQTDKQKNIQNYSNIITNIQEQKLQLEMKCQVYKQESEKYQQEIFLGKDQISTSLEALRLANARIKELTTKNDILMHDKQRLQQLVNYQPEEYTPRPSLAQLQSIVVAEEELNVLDSKIGIKYSTQEKVNAVADAAKRAFQSMHDKLLTLSEKVNSCQQNHLTKHTDHKNHHQLHKVEDGSHHLHRVDSSPKHVYRKMNTLSVHENNYSSNEVSSNSKNNSPQSRHLAVNQSQDLNKDTENEHFTFNIDDQLDNIKGKND